MTLDELLCNVREYYLSRFKEEIELKKCDTTTIIVESEIYIANDQLATSGFFDIPYRNDIVIVQNGVGSKAIIVNTEGMINFQPIKLSLAGEISLTIKPFQWNFLTIEFSKSADIDWTILRNWFLSSFEEKENDSPFKFAVHYMSDPYEENNRQKIDIDLGSASTDDFEDLLTALTQMNLREIIMG